MGIIPYTCFNLNNFGIVVWCLQNYCVTLPHMSISAGVVRAVALQQIDHAPHAKASAEGNHKGLQSGDGRSEKLHIASYSPGTKPRP